MTVKKFDPADPEVRFFQDNPDKLANLLGDIRKAQGRGQIAFTDDGLMVVRGDVNLQIGGVFDTWILRHEMVQRAIDDHDPEQEAWARQFVRDTGRLATREGFFETMRSQDHNLIPYYGLAAVLDIIFYTKTKISTWYHGPFTSNWTPVATARSNWSGATSGPLATELPDANFDESGRQAATFGVAATAGATTSISSSTATAITIATGVTPFTMYGSTLNESSTVAYNATDKVLLAATAFATAKSGLGPADVINLNYAITAASS